MAAPKILSFPKGQINLTPNNQYTPIGVFDCASEMVDVVGWTPDQMVTSKELEAEIKKIRPNLPPLDIEAVIGVRERRVASDSQSVVDMAVAACEKLLQRNKIPASMIDTVIYTSVSREYLEPATAILVCERLKIDRAKAFDVTNACLGFVDGWMLGDALIQSKRSRIVLVVGAEKSSPFWKMALQQMGSVSDKEASQLLPSFTLGDGAAAMLLGTRHNRSGSLHTLAGIRESFGDYKDLCIVKDTTTPMFTNARSLFTAALRHGPELFKTLAEGVQWPMDNIDLVIPHQASRKVMDQTARILKFPVEKAHITLDRFGNMASVSVPFTLAEALESPFKKNFQKMLVMGYGSGLGVGMLAVQRTK